MTTLTCDQLAEQISRDALFRRPAFYASLLAGALLIRNNEYVAWLTLQRLAHLLQRLKINAQRLALLQTPQRRMADACLFRQPIEGPSATGQ